MPETLHHTETTRNHRPSFRDKVLYKIRRAGIRGINHDQVMTLFKNEPRVKVTVALNELLGRREAYLRTGIYRATTYPEKE